MSEQPRDWDRELAAIDKVIAKGPQTGPAPAPAPAPAGRGQTPASAPGGRPPTTGWHVAGSWLRVVIALVLGAVLVVWPYGRVCGLRLIGFVGIAALTVITGGWAAVWTWRHRRGFGHALALLATAWGLGVLGWELLPRLGYGPGPKQEWSCPAPAPAVTPTQPAPAQPAPSSPAPGGGTSGGTSPASPAQTAQPTTGSSAQ